MTELKRVPSRYLLPCSCGKSIAVSVSQAGDKVHCECGQELEVPTLRQLRELAPEQTDSTESASWGFRQGVITLGLILASLMAATSGWFYATQPTPLQPFDASAWTEKVEEDLAVVDSPLAWSLWQARYKPLLTLDMTPMERLGESQLLAQIEQHRIYSTVFLIAAAVLLVMTLILGLDSPPLTPTDPTDALLA